MGIFIKRPLCLFCFCFMGAAILAAIMPTLYCLLSIVVSIVISLIVFVLSRIIKKRRYGLIEAFIALLFVVLAFTVSFLSIHLERQRNDKLCKENRIVQFLVLEKEYSSRYSSAYTGKLLVAGDEDVYIDARLKCEFEGEYKLGDSLYLVGNIEHNITLGGVSSKIPLSVIPTIDKDMIICEQYDRFDFSLFCARLQNKVREVFMSYLDYETAAFAVGLLTGNMSDMESSIERDFRRAGLSHVMAVSGLHLVVLLGSLDFVLKKLYVRKSVRCAVLSLSSFLLLILAGFSGSACRSVIMLLCAYLCFMLSRESDALTSLGVSGFVLMLVSPKTVFDIGFWMSFLATMGLVTWLSVLPTLSKLEERCKGKLSRALISPLSKIVAAIAIAFCANISICIISWLFFKEMSVIGILANIVVTPICDFYLLLTVLIFVLGGLPYVGQALAFVARILAQIITELTAFFASLDFSIVSLRYKFASVIIVAMTVILMTLLIVKLKHKIIIPIVLLLSVMGFSVCLYTYNTVNDSVKVTYVNDEFRDSVVLTNQNSAIIFDISDGTYSPIGNSVKVAKENYATYIDTIFLTHYHTKYISSLDGVFSTEMVKRLYIPMPADKDETNIFSDIVRLAYNNDVELITYEYNQILTLSDEMEVMVIGIGECEYSQRKIVSFVVQSQNQLLCYADSSWNASDKSEQVLPFVENSDFVIFGSHGPRYKEGEAVLENIKYPPTVICADKDLVSHWGTVNGEIDIITTENEENKILDFYMNK